MTFLNQKYLLYFLFERYTDLTLLLLSSVLVVKKRLMYSKSMFMFLSSVASCSFTFTDKEAVILYIKCCYE